MWGKKFGFLLAGALSSPFSLFTRTIGLQLQFIVIVILLALVLFLGMIGGIDGLNQMIVAMHTGTDFHMEPRTFGAGGILLFVLVYLFFILMIVAYFVYAMRLVAGEQNESSFLPLLVFNRSTLVTLWGYLKIWLLGLLILLPALIISGVGVLGSPVGEDNIKVVPESVVALTILAFIVSYAVLLYIGPRLYLVLPSAALGDGASISRSWSLTKGAWWLITLSLIVTMIVMVVGAFVTLFAMALIFAPLIYILSSFPPFLLVVPIFLVYGLLFFALINVMAGYMANLYLLQTNRVVLSDVEIKSKDAA